MKGDEKSKPISQMIEELFGREGCIESMECDLAERRKRAEDENAELDKREELHA